MLKKTISIMTVMSFLFVQVGFADVITNITPDEKTDTTVSRYGDIHIVNTNTIRGNTGFNSFSDFTLGTGDMANLNLPAGTNNLVNIVTGNNKSIIDGTLNAYRNGKMGGNVFFLNPNGIMIGANGVVNVGALTLATPNRKYIDEILEHNDHFDAGNFSNAVLSGDVPIASNGNISIKGKINAYYMWCA